MGFHVCDLCDSSSSNDPYFSTCSSGEVILEFKNGNRYQFPDMIFHYIADHLWHPPMVFIVDVMNLVPVELSKQFPLAPIERIGYLDVHTKEGGKFSKKVDWPLIGRLYALVLMAERMGQRQTTRGLHEH